MTSSYSGPKNIVIVGAGIAGLAAADAITKSLADFAATGRTLPPDLTVTVVEGERQVGGRATTWDVDDIDPQEHPQRHHAGNTPHGIHFFWHSYRHFDAWTSDFPQAFSPATPTSSYNMWVTPPDYPAGFDHEGALVPVHICDPRDPSSAWNPHARALLEAFLKRDALIVKLETFVRTFLATDIAVDDWLAFLDLLFDEEHLSPFLRWGVFFGPIFAAQLGRVETSPELKDLLGGRAPQDVEVGELMRPFFQTVVVERLRAAHAELAPLLQPDAQPTSVAPVDAALTAVRDTALKVAGGLLHGLQSIVGAATGGASAHPLEHAIEAFLELVLRDARVILDGASTFDPKSSGYLKNLYKAAFSSPFSFDLATAMRDIQMGHRNYECAKLQVFDGDDAQALWEHIKDRILARAPTVNVKLLTNTWVTRFDVDSSGAVSGVGIAPASSVQRQKRPVGMVDPVTRNVATASVLPADAVVCTLLPACVKPLLPKRDSTADLRRRLGVLGGYANETVNLQLLFRKKIALPFFDGPAGTTPPISISNIEGPFTILVDLARAWRPPTFKALRFDAAQSGDFAGTAWEMVGAWGDVFTHDDGAAPARAQWPLGAQEVLADLAQRAQHFEPWSVDARPWVIDQKRLTPPAFGQVEPDQRPGYFKRWVTRAGPLVVQQTLRLLAKMPGLAPADADYLQDIGDDVARGNLNDEIRFIFSKSAQAETKFHSSEPKLYALRPHARFEALPNLWLSGDWTRSGLNVQAMEGALIAGFQSGAGVIEALRAGGLDTLRGPPLRPDVVPNGAWDAGS